jgi:septum site-determining protein MinD
MGTSIIVASAKGGAGKTNTVVNLGVALAKQGKKVTLVDGSLTTPDVSLHLGIPFHVRGLAHLLQENAPLESAMFHHRSGMQVIPGSVHLSLLHEFEGNQFKNLMKQLKKDADLVLVDSAPGLGREALSAMKHCDRLLLVVNPELASIVHASKTIQVAKKHKIKTLGVVINRVGRHRHELSVKHIRSLLHNVPVVGSIREDRKVPKTVRKGRSLVEEHPRSHSSKQFHSIAATIVRGRPLPVFKPFHQRVWSALRKEFGKK